MPKLTPDITGAGDMLICGQFCLVCNGSEMSIHTNAPPRKYRSGNQTFVKLGRESANKYTSQIDGNGEIRAKNIIVVS